jgi:hypothetical protein
MVWQSISLTMSGVAGGAEDKTPLTRLTLGLGAHKVSLASEGWRTSDKGGGRIEHRRRKREKEKKRNREKEKKRKREKEKREKRKGKREET